MGCRFGVGDVCLKGFSEGLGDGLEEGILFWVRWDWWCRTGGCERRKVELEGGCE